MREAFYTVLAFACLIAAVLIFTAVIKPPTIQVVSGLTFVALGLIYGHKGGLDD